MTSLSRILLALSLSGLGLCAYAEHPEENPACDAAGRVIHPQHMAFEQAMRKHSLEGMTAAVQHPDFAKEEAAGSDLLRYVIREISHGGDTRALALLLPHCADVNRTSDAEMRNTPLHLAARAGNAEAVSLLLAHGASPLAENVGGRTPLMGALSKPAVITLLLQAAPESVNKADANGMTALLLAAQALSQNPQKADLEQTMRLLIQAGADVNHRAKNGTMALSFKLPASAEHLLRQAGAADPWETAEYQEAMQRYLAAAEQGNRNEAGEIRMQHNLLLNRPLDQTGKTLLMQAAAEGKEKVVEVLLMSGADAKVRDSDGLTAANYARAAKNERLLRLLQQAENGEAQRVQLHDAAFRGDVEKVRRLLQKGADPNAIQFGSSRPTVLQCACGTHQKELATMLLEAGADPNEVLGSTTPAFFEAFFGQESPLELAELYLKHGADVNLRDAAGCTALFHVVEWSFPHAEADVAWLLQHGAKADIVNKRGQTAHMRCRKPAALALLLNAAPQLADRADAEGLTPLLHVASRLQLPQYNDKGEDTNPNSADMTAQLRLLTERGVNVNAVDAQGRSALMFAARRAQRPAAELLLAAGADPTLRDAEGLSALSYAYEGGDEALFALLQERGAPAGVPEELAEAVAAGDAERARAAIDKGVDAERFGIRLAETALRAGRADMLMLLREAGVSPDAADAHHRTLLQRAVQRHDHAGIRLLLQAGADVNAKGVLGVGRHNGLSGVEGTALSEALSLGQADTARLLLEAGAAWNTKTYGGHYDDFTFALRGNDLACMQLVAEHGMLPPAGTLLSTLCNDEGLRQENLRNTELMRLLTDTMSMEDPYHSLLNAVLNAKAFDTLRLLLDKGYDTRSFDRFNRSVLYHCYNAPRDIIERLLETTPDINAAAKPEARGDTALIVLAAFRHYQWPEPKLTPEQLAEQDAETAEIVRLYLAAGADPKAKDAKGKTAADYARERGYTRCAELLK